VFFPLTPEIRLSGDANMTTTETTTNSQWVFPISALSCTPTAQERSLHEEMYDRSRGIEFLYRLGTSIGLFVRGQLFQPQFLLHMLNQTLVSPSAIPLAYSRLRRGSIASLCGILCLIIIVKLVSIPAALVAFSFVTNTSSDHRGRLHISCYKDRRVWKEAQGCS
jgi:hypothetical protein